MATWLVPMMRFLGATKPQCHTCRPRVTISFEKTLKVGAPPFRYLFAKQVPGAMLGKLPS